MGRFSILNNDKTDSEGLASLRLPHIGRRQLLIGGGLGLGLLVGYSFWPRDYLPNIQTNPNETLFNPFVKIGEDRVVTVFVGQTEYGQGVTTTLPQIVADELGADWRTIAVEPAPIHPAYANDFLVGIFVETLLFFLK